MRQIVYTDNNFAEQATYATSNAYETIKGLGVFVNADFPNCKGCRFEEDCNDEDRKLHNLFDIDDIVEII